VAVYQFSALSDGQAISFNPNADTLNFDQTAISAADVRVSAQGTGIHISAFGKDVLLLNSQVTQLTTGNVTFANGSRLVFGDNATAQTADNGSNSLAGTGGNDHLWGFGGRDALSGGAGNDWLAGGTGLDTLTGAGGADSFAFREAASNSNFDRVIDFISGVDRLMFHRDFFSGVDAASAFRAGAGLRTGQDADDRIIYDTSTGFLYYDADGGGGGGAQLVATLTGRPAVGASDIGAFDDTTTAPGGGPVTGTNGNDTLVGTAAGDVLDGLAGNDSISGLAGADSLFGGAGVDTLDGGTGIDTMTGGTDSDVYFVDDAGDFVVELDTEGGSDQVRSSITYRLPDWVENLVLTGNAGISGFGNDLNNTLIGNGAANFLEGGQGIDDLSGGAGNDTLAGGGGVDWMSGGAGADVFLFAETPGEGNLNLIRDFGSGSDVLQLDGAWIWNLGPSGRFAAGDDRFHSGPGATSAHDVGDRIIFDMSNGWLYFDADGTGDTWQPVHFATLQVGAPLAATDIIVVNGSPATGTNQTGTAGNDNMVGTPGDDGMEALAGNDTVDGLAGDDLLIGNEGHDLLIGGMDNDVLEGRSGDDTLLGGQGFDVLRGYEGNDVLDGGTGEDWLYSGPGADRMLFTQAPGEANLKRILEFTSGMDKLVLDTGAMPELGALGDFATGDERFYAAVGASSGHDATDRLIYNTSNSSLYYDSDGSGSAAAQRIASFVIDTPLSATDFTVVAATGGTHRVGTNGNDSLAGTAGHDTLEGLDGNDTLAGLAGNDSLVGNRGSDVLSGGDGDDTLDGAAGFDNRAFEQDFAADTIDGGFGNDVYYVQADDVLSDPGGLDSVYTDAWECILGAGLENLSYDPFEWSDGEGIFIDYTGNSLGNVITVGGLWINSGSVLDGGDGNDTLQGSGGDITYRFSAGSGNYGNDVIVGSDGTLDFADARSSIVANLGGSVTGGGIGGSGSVTFENMDNAIGGAHDDHIIASPGGFDNSQPAYIRGGGGNDTLEGGLGPAYALYGEDGNDRLTTQFADTLVGGSGSDEFVFLNPNDSVVMDFVSGTDKLVLDAQNTSVYGRAGAFAADDGRFYAAPGAFSGHDADDRVIYNTTTGELAYDEDGSGALEARHQGFLRPGTTLVAGDIVIENAAMTGGMALDGTGGDDALTGGAGNDTLRGLGGRDTLSGAGGDDWLEGGTGVDSLTGGAGVDSFVFRETPTNSNFDRLLDFTSEIDSLRFDDAVYTRLGAPGDFGAGDDRFFAGAGARSGVDAEDRLIYDTSTGNLWYDADGSGAGGQLFVGVLQGAPGLVATDIAII
jgi:Ca2+-binding RTX toxin-like protein